MKVNQFRNILKMHIEDCDYFYNQARLQLLSEEGSNHFDGLDEEQEIVSRMIENLIDTLNENK
jgi:hypothetical protein